MLYKVFLNGKWLIGIYNKRKNLFTDFDKRKFYYRPKEKEKVKAIDCCDNCPKVFNKYIPDCGYPSVFGDKNLELTQQCPHYKTKRFEELREKRIRQIAVELGEEI